MGRHVKLYLYFWAHGIKHDQIIVSVALGQVFEGEHPPRYSI